MINIRARSAMYAILLIFNIAFGSSEFHKSFGFLALKPIAKHRCA